MTPGDQTNNLHTRTIAIVDDSHLVLEMVKGALQTEGYRVMTAGTLAELEAAIEVTPPDLLLVDVDMPEMYGDDVALVLRLVRNLKVPIWLFSNRDDLELAQRARQAQADGFISKASGMAGLVKEVRAILERRASSSPP